jgi:O-antigen ligase
MVVFTLAGIGLIFSYAVFRSGAGLGEDWYVCGALLGLVSVAYGLMTPRRKMAPAPTLVFSLVLAGLLALCWLQLVPFPISFVETVSPARAALRHPLVPIVGPLESAPFSLAPAASFRYLVVLISCSVAFLLARNIAWRSKERLWRVVAPFVGVAFLEALLGLAQRYWAGNPLAQGTYVNRNHFAGLLEMALPFAVMGAVAFWYQHDLEEERGVVQTLKACGLLIVATALLAAIVHSLSRMGFLAALVALLVAGMMWFSMSSTSKRSRLLAAGVGVVIVVGFLFLPTDPLLHRFAALASTEEITANTRVEIWRETWQLIETYPWLGVGLGGYESSFVAYKTVAPLNLVDFAHNDYLQYLVELGVIGFTLLGFLAVRTVVQAVRMGSAAEDVDERCFGIAAAASLVAIALHSFVDFNLYVPAHMLMVAWVAGAVDALSPRSQQRRASARERSQPDEALVEAETEYELSASIEFAARVPWAVA